MLPRMYVCVATLYICMICTYVQYLYYVYMYACGCVFMLCLLLPQLITYNGFYDSNLEFVSMEGVQIVGSMNPSSSLGRHLLTTRLTSVVCVCSMPYPDHEELETIYATYFSAFCQSRLEDHPVWSNPSKPQLLAASIVKIYTAVSAERAGCRLQPWIL